MGTPAVRTTEQINTIDYILRGHRIPADELSPEQWLEIVKSMLVRYKPYATYLPLIHDPRLALSGITEYAGAAPFCPVPHSLNALEFWLEDETFNSETRLIPIAALEMCPARGVSGEPIHEHYLFLTTRFEWVHLLRTARRENYRHGASFIEQEFAFDRIADDELLVRLQGGNAVWPRIIKTLQRLMEEAIKDKMKRVTNMQKAMQEEDAMLARIIFSD